MAKETDSVDYVQLSFFDTSGYPGNIEGKYYSKEIEEAIFKLRKAKLYTEKCEEKERLRKEKEAERKIQKERERKDAYPEMIFGRWRYTQDHRRSPLKWLVLECGNNEMLLISKYIIVSKCFLMPNKPFATDDPETRYNYEKSIIRNFLNETFYNNAFNADEKKLIIPGEQGFMSDLVNISTIEIAEKYFKNDEKRKCKYIYENEEDKVIQEYGKWWLRDESDTFRNYAAVVDGDGSINTKGAHTMCGWGYRPVIYLSSSYCISDTKNRL